LDLFSNAGIVQVKSGNYFSDFLQLVRQECHCSDKGFIRFLKSGSGEINCRYPDKYIMDIDFRELIHHVFHGEHGINSGF